MDAEQASELSPDLSPPTGWTTRRERHNIFQALACVSSGSAVLYLPCGSGRWLESLVSRGFHVTCADRSESVLAEASRRWQQIAPACAQGVPPEFVLAEPSQTHFSDHQFDAVLCTGLFDRLETSALRIATLRELRRISRGPVIVSFCNAFALGALRLARARKSWSTASELSIPVPVWAFLNDLRRAGLTPIARHGVLWGISPLWHIVSVPAACSCDTLLSPARIGLAKTA